ncbi:MAG: hypothetical protein KKA19_04435, partial [Candidatus Margulisbacteria bacterium]|nr:hypothetical protein [Candidatus Margulisiibacteriota bacterium]
IIIFSLVLVQTVSANEYHAYKILYEEAQSERSGRIFNSWSSIICGSLGVLIGLGGLTTITEANSMLVIVWLPVSLLGTSAISSGINKLNTPGDYENKHNVIKDFDNDYREKESFIFIKQKSDKAKAANFLGFLGIKTKEEQVYQKYLNVKNKDTSF